MRKFLASTLVCLSFAVLFASCTGASASGHRIPVHDTVSVDSFDLETATEIAFQTDKFVNYVYEWAGDAVRHNDDPNAVTVLVADESLYTLNRFTWAQAVYTPHSCIMSALADKLRERDLPYKITRVPAVRDGMTDEEWMISWDLNLYLPVFGEEVANH